MTRSVLDHVRDLCRGVIRSVGVVIRRTFPERLYGPVQARWRLLRTQKHVTKLLGPEFKRSRRFIEIDITYACNLNCYNCNRSCEQAPTGEHMSREQIQHFVDEWIGEKKVWDRIRILGGEPTIHKDFLEILEIFRSYRRTHAPGAIIEVVTNGYGEKVDAAIRSIPSDVQVNNTAKESKVQPQFCSFNIAPIDVPDYRDTDYTNGCMVTEVCGTGLGPGGYYPCAVAGGIDRIFGWNLGRHCLPKEDDGMQAELKRFCSVCGYYKRLPEAPLAGPVKSQTWEEAYKKYRSDIRHRLGRAPQDHDEVDPGVRPAAGR
jgi:Radical SAM superfamily